MATWDFGCSMSLHVSLQVCLALKTAATLGAQVVSYFIVTLCVYLQSALAVKSLATKITHMCAFTHLPKVCVNIFLVIGKTRQGVKG